ncbi:MAG: YidC/Oxa1 family membrane protein insertase [Tissierellia bacterium]|nr:YidC/Oxa1 family membrane protein insertase [Tissierellia bacterium]
MLTFLATILGYVLKFIYQMLSQAMNEPSLISFYAISIIIMTFLVKLITIPITLNTQKSSQQMSELSPEVEKLKKKYGYDQRVLQQKTQELYKEKGVSVMGCSSCLMLLIQFLILMALIRVIRDPAQFMFESKSEFESISKNFFWIKDLNQMDPLWFGLPLMTSLSQFAVSLFSMKTNKAQQNSQMGSMNTMLMVLPLAYYFVFRSMPAALPLYWTMSSVIEIIFRVIMYFFFSNHKERIKED